MVFVDYVQWYKPALFVSCHQSYGIVVTFIDPGPFLGW